LAEGKASRYPVLRPPGGSVVLVRAFRPGVQAAGGDDAAA
jgi:hypothetical protein